MIFFKMKECVQGTITHADERPNLFSGIWWPSPKNVPQSILGSAVVTNNPQFLPQSRRNKATKFYSLLTLAVHCSLPRASANHDNTGTQVIRQSSPPMASNVKGSTESLTVAFCPPVYHLSLCFLLLGQDRSCDPTHLGSAALPGA